jgi:hypothetical protein
LATLDSVQVRDPLEVCCHEAEQLARRHGKDVRIVRGIESLILGREATNVLTLATRRALSHAIRRSIESREARRRARKNEVARIYVELRVVAGQATLTIEDDGAGVTHGDVTTDTWQREPGDEVEHNLDFDAVRSALATEQGTINVRNAVGRGTVVRMTIPDAVTEISVRAFRAPLSEVLFCVPASWTVASAGDARSLDPLLSLGLEVKAARGLSGRHAASSLYLARGDERVSVSVRAPPTLCVASALCPTADDSPAEVVVIGSTDALLIRPERLASSPPSAHSTTTMRPAAANSDWPPTSLRSRAVLVADVAMDAVLVRAALVRRGFDVHLAGTSDDFAGALALRRFDAVVVGRLSGAGVEMLRAQVRRTHPLAAFLALDDGWRADDRCASTPDRPGISVENLVSRIEELCP